MRTSSLLLSDERVKSTEFTMSVVASRPERAPMPYNTTPYQSHVSHTYTGSNGSAYSVSIESVSSRKCSVSSYMSNYSQSTAPSIYSPTSPSSPNFSYSMFKAALTPAPAPKPAEPIFKRLPPEVYDCILRHLELEHTGAHKSGCLTCFQRDLHSLALTNRAWEKAVRSKL